MAGLRELTDKAIRAYQLGFLTSSDVRKGTCRLEDCYKAVTGLWYEPEEVLAGFSASVREYKIPYGCFPPP